MAKATETGRETQAKPSQSRENKTTSGGIETAVQGFFGNITTSAPFSNQYGNHKAPGSQMLSVKSGGRGGAKTFFRNKMKEAD